MKVKTIESAVVTVPEAGVILGLRRGAAYNAAKNGQIPVIRIGKLLKVPKAALEQMLLGTTAPNPARKQTA